MQSPVNNFKDILLNWNTFSFQASLIDAAIACCLLTVFLWFLISRYYRARLKNVRSNLKGQLLAVDQEREQLNVSLSTANADYQRSQQELAEKQQHVLQLQQNQALAQEEIKKGQVFESQVKSHVDELSTRFFKDQPLAAVSVDNSVWQQLNDLAAALIHRLTAHEQDQQRIQSDYAKLSDLYVAQESAINELNQKIAAQRSQINDLQATLAKQQTESFSPQANIVQAAISTVEAKLQTSVASSNSASSLSESFQPVTETTIAETVEVSVVTPASEPTPTVEPLDSVESFIHESENKIQGIFNKLKFNFKSSEKSKSAQPTENSESAAKNAAVAYPQIVTRTVETIVEAETMAATEAQPAAEQDWALEKLKGAFGFGKKVSSKSEVINNDNVLTSKAETVVAQEISRPIAVNTDSESTVETVSQPVVEQDWALEKLKGMLGFGKKSAAVTTEPAIAANTSASDSPREVIAQVRPLDTGAAAVTSGVEDAASTDKASSRFGFGFGKKTVDGAGSESVITPETIASTNVPEQTASEKKSFFKFGKQKTGDLASVTEVGEQTESTYAQVSNAVNETLSPRQIDAPTAQQDSADIHIPVSKLKNVLGFGKQKTAIQSDVAEAKAEIASIAESQETQSDSMLNKLSGLWGRGKSTIVEEVVEAVEQVEVVAEAAMQEVEAETAAASSKLKGLFGRFKKSK